MAPPGINVLGQRFIIDLRTKHMVRKSPGANARARCIAKEARGKNLDARKEVFASKCKGTKGS